MQTPLITASPHAMRGRDVIICSCTVITDRHVEDALLELLSREDAPLPTPGIVFRHLGKKMNCCGCAPLSVDTIYKTIERLEREGRLCPYACATARTRLGMVEVRQRRRVFARSRIEARAVPRRGVPLVRTG